MARETSTDLKSRDRIQRRDAAWREGFLALQGTRRVQIRNSPTRNARTSTSAGLACTIATKKVKATQPKEVLDGRAPLVHAYINIMPLKSLD